MFQDRRSFDRRSLEITILATFDFVRPFVTPSSCQNYLVSQVKTIWVIVWMVGWVDAIE
jgi:hypothetical protein